MAMEEATKIGVYLILASPNDDPKRSISSFASVLLVPPKNPSKLVRRSAPLMFKVDHELVSWYIWIVVFNLLNPTVVFRTNICALVLLPRGFGQLRFAR
jgi:hypothetical protein